MYKNAATKRTHYVFTKLTIWTMMMSLLFISLWSTSWWTDGQAPGEFWSSNHFAYTQLYYTSECIAYCHWRSISCIPMRFCFVYIYCVATYLIFKYICHNIYGVLPYKFTIDSDPFQTFTVYRTSERLKWNRRTMRMFSDQMCVYVCVCVSRCGFGFAVNC